MGRSALRRRWLLPALLLGLVAPSGLQAGYLDDALEAGEQGITYFEVSWTGAYQYALEAETDAGPWELDLLGSVVLRRGEEEASIGDTDLVFWLFTVDNLGGLRPTGHLRSEAGLLWDPNDINVDSSLTQFGTFGIRQFFAADRLELGIGKVFPGLIHTESPYTGNNSDTFMSKVVSASAVGRYFEAIGLGLNLKYSGRGWFVQAGLSDVKAEEEFDFSSFADGVYAWTGEVGWEPVRAEGKTSLSLLGFRVDETAMLSSESGLAVAGTHDFGEESLFGLFGRYTYRDGGEAFEPKDAGSELPLTHGGFLGFAWNRPFGRDLDQVGVAVLYGKPTEHRRRLGFDTQIGVEAYWSLGLPLSLRLTPSVQLVRNRDDDFEVVLGLRLKVSKDFTVAR